MQKHIKTLFKDKIIFIAIAIGITLLIGYLSLKQFEGDSTFQFEQMDKIAHAISYCVLTLSWLLAIKDVRLKSKLQNTIALSCMLYGMVIEVLQTTLTTYRTASFLDILANLVGIIIALLLFKSVFKKIRAI